MISFDVISLLTSIPVDFALQVVLESLQYDGDLSSRTNLSINNIMKLLKFILYIPFLYIRRNTSTKFLVVPWDFVMQVTEKAVSSSNIRLGWWYRVVDDGHSCVQKEKMLPIFLHTLIALVFILNLQWKWRRTAAYHFLTRLRNGTETRHWSKFNANRYTDTNIWISIPVILTSTRDR